MPRIALRLTAAPISDGSRLAGHGTIDQIAGDLGQLRSLGAGTVVLDPFNGDHRETAHPETAWRALATVAEHWNRQENHKTSIPNGAEVAHTAHAEGDPGGVAPEDLPHLRRCVELAAEAVDAGDHPFGSVLVAADGRGPGRGPQPREHHGRRDPAPGVRAGPLGRGQHDRGRPGRRHRLHLG